MAASFAARAGSVTARTAAARPAGSRFAVTVLHPGDSSYVCAPSSGIASGSSGASFASRSDRSTDARSDVSSSLFVVVLALRVPNVLRIDTMTLALSPPLDTWFTANRVFPRAPAMIDTRVCSALANASTRLASACASSFERKPGGSNSDRGLMPSSPC